MKPKEHEACLLLGSNIRPEENILRAVDLLQKQVDILRASSVWETTAVGSDGPNFLNAALLVLTPLDREALKERILRPIEAQLGRVRTRDKNAARTIDIDILLFDGRVLDAALWEYAFRAVPAAEVSPGSVSETGEKLGDAAARLSHTAQISLRADIPIAQFIK